MCQCQCPQARRGFRPIAFLFNIVLAWAVLVLGGGTLINTGHPVAAEAGRLIQTVTFVEPAINWADGHDMQPLAKGLRVLQGGVRVGSDDQRSS